MRHDICPEENHEHRAFWSLDFATIVILLLLHGLLLWWTVHHEYLRRDRAVARAKTLPLLYLTMQLLSIVWISVNGIRDIVDPFVHFLRSNIGWLSWSNSTR